MTFTIPKKQSNTEIRKINLGNIETGGESSLFFMHSENEKGLKPLVAVEILMNIPANYPELLTKAWGENLLSTVNWAKAAIKSGADALTIRFNVDENNLSSEIQRAKKILEEISMIKDIPLIIIGSNKNNIDKELLPELAKVAAKACTIGVVEESNYKEIIPSIMQYEHNVIARTPIDINLAKELNILITEKGFNPDKILIDPNMGGLGYGLDYGYSVIERIKSAALTGDETLNMPIIVFVGEEAWKTKESKTSNTPEEWGNINDRAIMWESITASSVLSAGANIISVYHPDSVKYLKNFIQNL